MHIVTGKGGVGKSTVSAALALALATNGRRVLLVEVEERQQIARMFDLPPLPYEERRIAVASGGGEVRALAIDVQAAMLEYLAMFYNLGFATRTLKKMGAIEFATTLAPGLRDVLLTGKTKETVSRRGTDGRPVYDAVVMDAPPTGRITSFLNVTVAMTDLAKKGPIRAQADGVAAVLHSPDTTVHLVTLLEDMPVTETLEGIEQLRAVGLPVGTVIVNAATAARLPEQDLAGRGGGRSSTWTGWPPAWPGPASTPSDDVLDGLAAQAGDHAARILSEQSLRADLDGAGLPGADPAPPRRRSRPRRDLRTRRPAGRARRQVTTHPRNPPLHLVELVCDPETKVVVTCGSGGVGKTTTAAAMAVVAADARAHGRRADHRPGAATRPVARPDRAGQRARGSWSGTALGSSTR